MEKKASSEDVLVADDTQAGLVLVVVVFLLIGVAFEKVSALLNTSDKGEDDVYNHEEVEYYVELGDGAPSQRLQVECYDVHLKEDCTDVGNVSQLGPDQSVLVVWQNDVARQFLLESRSRGFWLLRSNLRCNFRESELPKHYHDSDLLPVC
jgi:hypothetical protein